METRIKILLVPAVPVSRQTEMCKEIHAVLSSSTDVLSVLMLASATKL